MKNILFLLIFVGPSAWARVCTLAEIRVLDTARIGGDYSPYPMMTKANAVASLLPLLPHLDAVSEESTGFQAVTFIGLGGWIYFGLQIIASTPCEDPRDGGVFYEPNLSELLKFHHQEKDLFLKSYLWSSLWMVGIMATSNYSDRKSMAMAALVIPWLFSSRGKWPGFAPDEELQIVILPRFENNKLELYPGLVWSF